MSISLQNILDKTVLVGLSYFNRQGDLIQQRQLCGKVVETDNEKGIAIQRTDQGSDEESYFVLPSSLDCWFHAPKGDFFDSESGVKISNPDFLVTWDVHQKQEAVEEGDHQWWEWYPRTTPPQVSGKQ